MTEVDHRARQCTEEPRQPVSHVERAFLRAFEGVVVVLALTLDLRRQAVEASRTAVGASKKQVAHGARDASVSVVERVQRDQPQMREAGFYERGFARFRVRPRQEFHRLGGQRVGRRGW